MATHDFVITDDVWTKVSEPGESGTCWKTTSGRVLVDHTISTAGTIAITAGTLTIEKAKLVPQDFGTADVLLLSADGATDTFYAITLETDSQKIVTDMKAAT